MRGEPAPRALINAAHAEFQSIRFTDPVTKGIADLDVCLAIDPVKLLAFGMSLA
jgi:hypothetical protein